MGCWSIWVKWWRSFWFSIKNPIFWILQMTLKMKSYSREKNMKGDYNVSSISHFKYQWSCKYERGFCIAFVKISCFQIGYFKIRDSSIVRLTDHVFMGLKIVHLMIYNSSELRWQICVCLYLTSPSQYLFFLRVGNITCHHVAIVIIVAIVFTIIIVTIMVMMTPWSSSSTSLRHHHDHISLRACFVEQCELVKRGQHPQTSGSLK